MDSSELLENIKGAAARHDVQIEIGEILDDDDAHQITVNVDPNISVLRLSEFLVDTTGFANYRPYDNFGGKLAVKVVKFKTLRLIFEPAEPEEIIG